MADFDGYMNGSRLNDRQALDDMRRRKIAYVEDPHNVDRCACIYAAGGSVKRGEIVIIRGCRRGMSEYYPS